ncbi:MFS transporter [Streptomyces coeruleorubidus]|uniref:MFS transporter n=1 Tax=Streptomyces coeruleorubidus TaxID=116188 RepID=UPI00339DFE4B
MTTDSGELAQDSTREPDDPAASLRVARSVSRPFYLYAVLANSLFQRGVFVLYLVHQGFSAAQIALLQTLLYIVSALAEIPTGFIADRVGRRACIVIGQALIGACLIGQVTLSGYAAFVVLFALQGIGMACVSGAETALLYDLLRRRGAETHYVKVKSRYATFGATTMALAIALGGSLQQVSWELVYLASACALLLAAAVLLTRVPEIRGQDAAALDEPGEADGEAGRSSAGPVASPERAGAPLGKAAVLRHLTPRLASLVVVSALMHATMTPYFIFTQETLSHQGIATTLVSVVMAAGYLIGGFAPLLADRADRRLGVQLLVPLTLLVLVAALGFTSLGLAWLTVGVFLLAVGAPDITAVVVDNVFNEGVPSRYRASLLSIITFVESLLIGCGYLVLGWLVDRAGPSHGLAWYALVPALALALSVPALRKGTWVKGEKTG